MDMTPGRAIYNPDETLKPLRQPKLMRPDGQTTSMDHHGMPHSGLSAAANVFVPRFGGVVGGNALQERLQRHQQQYLQETYHNYQQPQQQHQPQQQYNFGVDQFSNGYGQQQQLMTQMNSMNINNGGGGVQDRLHISNNTRGGGGVGLGGSSVNAAGNSSANSSYYQYSQNQTTSSYNRTYNKHNHSNHQNNHNHHQPRFNNHHSYQNQNQHRQNHYHNQQHQQQSTYQEQQSNQSTSTGSGSSSAAADAAAAADDMQNIALDYLQSVIQCLNQNPGQFDSIATRFITIFDGMENNHYVLSIAMEDIFKESIKNPNFRYMGAKLYNLLHMLNPQKDSLFHTFLKCKLDFHQQIMKGFMEKHQENKVRETALFLAELYMQLRGDDSRIYLIAENIVFSLKQLLDHVVNENVRCICLTLKLAGYDLSSDCPGDMMEIITKLELINSENPGKYPLASNVIALQKNNWGRKVSGSESLGDPETSKPPEPPRVSDDPVFYGPDGREITAEECEFLTNGAGGNGGSTDNEDNDLDDLDPEMDEETERDYKLFLKQANNS